jgi:hypothetical protein
VPGAVDIFGTAHQYATILVNGQSTYRKVDYFQKALALAQQFRADFPAITNAALMNGRTL